MRRITVMFVCIWLILGAAAAFAQEETDAAPPPEQTDQVAPPTPIPQT